jgi:hypothetical protein
MIRLTPGRPLARCDDDLTQRNTGIWGPRRIGEFLHVEAIANSSRSEVIRAASKIRCQQC